MRIPKRSTQNNSVDIETKTWKEKANTTRKYVRNIQYKKQNESKRYVVHILSSRQQ